jgi:hypothetical protein
MLRFNLFLWSLIVAGLVFGAGCSKRMLPGTPGAGGGTLTGGGGSGGVFGGDPGTGGMSGDPGSGGMSGIGGAPITSCPVSEPMAPIACSGSFGCRFTTFCTCHGCCSSGWRCIDGIFGSSGLDYNDGCFQGPPCPDGGAGSGGTATGSGGSGSGVGGGSGGVGQAGTGGSAAGGTTGAGGGTPFTSCPASRPVVGSPCDGSFSCYFQEWCRCGFCCQSYYLCANGSIELLGVKDACIVTCDAGFTDGP